MRQRSPVNAETADKQRHSNGTFAPGNTLGIRRGQSGNPCGRPKRPSLTESLLRKLEELAPGEDSQTGFDALVDAVRDELLKASPWAVEQFWNRLEGKPNSIPVEDAREFARALLDAVRRHVSNPDELRAIAADMAAIYAPASRELQTERSGGSMPAIEADSTISPGCAFPPVTFAVR